MSRFKIFLFLTFSIISFGFQAQNDLMKIRLDIEKYDNDEYSSLENRNNILKRLESSSKKINDSIYVEVLYRKCKFQIFSLDDTDAALKTIDEIKKLYYKNKQDPNYLVKYNYLLGILYSVQADNEERSSYYIGKAIKLVKKYDLKVGYDFYNNYALYFINQEKYEDALENFFKAYDLYSKQPGYKSKEFISLYHINLSVTYINLYKDSLAVKHLKIAAETAKRNNYSNLYLRSQAFLAIFYQEIKLNNEAMALFQTIEPIMKKEKDYKLKSVYYMAYADMYKIMNNLDKAYETLKYYQVVKDSLELLKQNDKIYLFELKSEVHDLKLKKKLYQAEIKTKEKTKLIYLILLISITLLLVFSIWFLRQRMKRQKILNELEKQKEFLERERIKNQAEIELLKKDEQIVSANVEISQRTKDLNYLKESLNVFLDNRHDHNFSDLKRFVRQIENSEKRTEQTKQLFQILGHENSQFTIRLKEMYPKLSEDEVKFIMLLRMNLGTDELLTIYNINKESLNTKRYRVRKKLNLTKETVLDDFIKKL
jgi:hypothetical protein